MSTSQAQIDALLKALSVGVRSASTLQTSSTFDFLTSFPSFQNLSATSRSQVTNLLSTLTKEALDDDASDDPGQWDVVADVIDQLMERCSDNTTSGASLKQLKADTTSLAATARGNIDDDLQKSQQLYNFKPVNNDRTSVFVPLLTEKRHAVVPMTGALSEGHGFDVDDNLCIVAPSHHHPHPYSTEITSLRYAPSQLLPPSIPIPPTGHNNTLHPVDTLDPRTTYLRPDGAHMIDTVAALNALASRLATSNAITEIAVDLEHHSYRSFAGFTCLMQLSVRPSTCDASSTDPILSHADFLIDTLVLRAAIGPALAGVFADPAVVKVMHGATNDVQWLQADFGIYIVNLFDSYHASKTLNLETFGLKCLLEKYAGYAADKGQQLADWRVRPLPVKLISYARGDTHFLLDVYDCLRRDLTIAGSTLVEKVLEESKGVCLGRYGGQGGECFVKEGWKVLVRRRDGLSSRQEDCLEKLWEWRDSVARREDESLGYVCSGQALLRIAKALPGKMGGLVSLFNPVTVWVGIEKENVLGIVRGSKEAKGKEEKGGSSVEGEGVSALRASARVFEFKKVGGEEEEAEEARARLIMSPVLGTKALYMQAGWLSDEKSGVGSEGLGGADDDGAGGHVTSNYSEHSMVRRGGKVTVTAGGDVDEMEMAGKISEEVRRGFVGGSAFGSVVKVKTVNLGDIALGDGVGGDAARRETMTPSPVPDAKDIPKSMSDIYAISNRNRRKKKSGEAEAGESEEEGGAPKAKDEVARAEAVLAKVGGEGGYFGGDRKKQKKGEGEDELEMMKDIGWVKDGEEEGLRMEGGEEGSGMDVEGEEKSGKGRRRGRHKRVGEGLAVRSSSVGVGAVGTGFSYGDSDVVGAFNGSVASNPFFAGSANAMGGGGGGKKGGKKGGESGPSQGRGDGRVVERPDRTQELSYLHKTNKR